MHRIALLGLACVLVVTLFATASIADQGRPAHIMLVAKDIQWKPGPPSLPPGAQVAVIEGDLAKAAPFTMRAKIPANYKIMPHSHPAVEHVTVLDGSCSMGLGEKWDDKALTELGAGGFAVMEVGTKHFFGSGKRGCTIQLHGVGPWGITYVNPADDPRNQKK